MIDYLQLKPEREAIAQACRVMGKMGLTQSTFGHISLRLDGHDLLLIRARGPGESGLSYTTADDIILVDFDGRKIAGRPDLDVPKEIYIHTWVLKTRPEMHSVLHAHPAKVMLFSICNKPLLPLFGAYDPSALRLLKKDLCAYPRSILINNEALGQELAQTMLHSKACMMRGHGITTCGKSVQDATLTAIRLYELADINYQAHLLGDPQPISEEDQESFENLPPSPDEAYWRYYCRKVDE